MMLIQFIIILMLFISLMFVLSLLLIWGSLLWILPDWEQHSQVPGPRDCWENDCCYRWCSFEGGINWWCCHMHCEELSTCTSLSLNEASHTYIKLKICWSNEDYKFHQGLGSPVFDKLEAELAKAVLSLPASKGFEIGSGFGGRNLVWFFGAWYGRNSCFAVAATLTFLNLKPVQVHF